MANVPFAPIMKFMCLNPRTQANMLPWHRVKKCRNHPPLVPFRLFFFLPSHYAFDFPEALEISVTCRSVITW